MIDERGGWDAGAEGLDGARLRDLAKDGELAPIVDSLLRPVEAERDAYREVAIENVLALREMARRDVEAEATRREQGRPRLRSV